MAAGGIAWFTYTGQEEIPNGATHIFVLARIIPRRAFYEHPNIIEIICHDIVVHIGECAFFCCPNLRRVIMPGVEDVDSFAFFGCRALTDVECDMLEIIGEKAFEFCESLRSIDLPSATIVVEYAFNYCEALTEVKFGSKLERFEGARPMIEETGRRVFADCTSLERVTIPLKDGIITADDIFQGCGNLKHVDLVEGELHETISALQLEEWRNDMNREIDSINRILLNTDDGEKARAIRRWIKSVLHSIIYYQGKHKRILDGGVASALELALPRDTVLNHVLPFLELPPHTFEVEFETMNEEDLFIYDEDDDDESVESRHRCCCLRKLWPSR